MSARGKKSAEATDQIKELPNTADRTSRRYPGVSFDATPARAVVGIRSSIGLLGVTVAG